MVGAPHWEPARGAPTMPTSGVSGQGDGDADTAGEGDRGDGDVVPTGGVHRLQLLGVELGVLLDVLGVLFDVVFFCGAFVEIR